MCSGGWVLERQPTVASTTLPAEVLSLRFLMFLLQSTGPLSRAEYGLKIKAGISNQKVYLNYTFATECMPLAWGPLHSNAGCHHSCAIMHFPSYMSIAKVGALDNVHITWNE
jgi:hypothetical protein